MSWRQPWDVMCPVCRAMPGELCHILPHDEPTTKDPLFTGGGLAYAEARLKRVAHQRRYAVSLRGKKVPLA